MWGMAVAAALAVALTGASAPTASPQGTSRTLDVFVGYADSDRAAAASFPTPWADTSNGSVIFEGCQPTTKCSYDGGALRLLNNSGAAMTVNSVTLAYSASCVYDIWPHNVSLPSGKQIIITQLTSGSANGCTNSATTGATGYGQMDGSDIGTNGAPWASNCTQSGVIPQVALTVNGATSTFTDSGQVLNTGGTDSAYCPSNPDGTARNESTQWTPIGHVACPGASLGLTPASQTNFQGGTASLTAKLTDSCGNPLQGSTISFHVFGANAPNAGTAGSGIANAAGNVFFRYADTRPGSDQVQASVTNAVGTFSSNIVAVNWVGVPSGPIPQGVITNLSLNPSAFAAAPSGPSVAVAKKRRFGASVTYSDSQTATTTFTVQRRLPGRLRGNACVKPNKRNRGHKACMRFMAVGSFTHADVAGANRFRFTGRVGGRKLRPGGYRLRAVPRSAAGVGPPAFTPFSIVR